MTLHLIDWIIIAVYMVGCTAAGIWMRRFVRNVDDFAVAGREMDINLGVASLAATEMGIVTVMYTAEMGFSSGFAGASPGLLIAAAMLLVGVTGFVIGPLRRAGVLTIPELFENRFGKHVRWLAGLVIVTGGILNMGIFLRLGGEFLVHVTGLPKEYLELTMTGLLLVVLLYTVLGGMLSVLVTDYIQFIVMGLGIVITSVLVVHSIGWSELLSELSEAHSISATAEVARKAAEEADAAAEKVASGDLPRKASLQVSPASEAINAGKTAHSAAESAKVAAKEASAAAEEAGSAAARSFTGMEGIGITAAEAKQAARKASEAAKNAAEQAKRAQDTAEGASAAARRAQVASDVAGTWGRQESAVEAAKKAAQQAQSAAARALNARDEAVAAATALAKTAQHTAVVAREASAEAFAARHDVAQIATAVAKDTLDTAEKTKIASGQKSLGSEEAVQLRAQTQIAAERARIAAQNVNGAIGGSELKNPFNPMGSDGIGWKWILWQAMLALAVVTTWQTNIARVLAAKDDKTARKVYRHTAFYFVGRFALPGLWGAAAFYYFWSKGGLPEGLNSLTAMPAYLGTLLPVGVIGIMIAAMLAAEMSTDSGYLLTWATVIYNDVVMPLLRRPPSPRVKLLVVRSLVVVIGIFLMVYGLWYELPGRAWDYLAVTGNIYLASVFSLLVGALYWRGANSWGAIASLILGAIGPITFLVYNAYVTDPKQQISPEMAGFSAFGLAIAGMIFGSLLGRAMGRGYAGAIPGQTRPEEIAR